MKDQVRRTFAQICQDRFQCNHVAVDVGDDCDAHRFFKQSAASQMALGVDGADRFFEAVLSYCD